MSATYTWEHASEDAFGEIEAWPHSWDIHHLPQLLKSAFNNADRWARIDVYQLFLGAGKAALIELRDEHTFSSEQFLGLMSKKHHDYGPGNILGFGIPGIHIRLHDKVCRYQSLEKRGSHAVDGESLFDTLVDILGYSVVALMVLDDTFELPLSLDLPTLDVGWAVDSAGVVSRG